MFAPKRDHDCSESLAAEGLLSDPQRAFRVVCANEDESGWIDAKFAQAGCVETACFAIEKILPRDQNVARSCRSFRQRQSDPCSGGRVGVPGGENFVQRATGEPAR
jgi:hypothetical protein